MIISIDNLTPAELADLTKLHAAAFDLVRKTAAENDERPPMWLCMSAEARRLREAGNPRAFFA